MDKADDIHDDSRDTHQEDEDDPSEPASPTTVSPAIKPKSAIKGEKKASVKFKAIQFVDGDGGGKADDTVRWDEDPQGMEQKTDVKLALEHGKELEDESVIDGDPPHKPTGFHPPARRQSLAEHLAHQNIGHGRKYDSSNNQMLVELDELQLRDDQTYKWQESARWIKYEENFEPGSTRWSKPHVASLSFHSLTQLRDCIDQGVVLFDVEETNMEDIWERILDEFISANMLPEKNRERLRDVLHIKHKHVSQHTIAERLRRRSSTMPPHIARRRRSSAESIASKKTSARLQEINEKYNHNNNSDDLRRYSKSESDNEKDDDTVKKNGRHVAYENDAYSDDPEDPPTEHKRRKSNISINSLLPKDNLHKLFAEGAEATNVLVGKLDFLDQPLVMFIRLDEAVQLGDMTEGYLPTRYMFLALGPHGDGHNYYELGRSFGTIMATLDFQQVAFDTMSKTSLMKGIHHFLDDSLVLPAGDWDEDLLLPVIQMAKKKASEVRRKSLHPLAVSSLLAQLNIDPYGDPLKRTKKPFGGMINDLKRRYPVYLSDLKDGLNAQCFATFFFIFFACLAPAITFGGLLGEKVDGRMGVSELLLATAVFGVINALFSTQPMMIIGLTGPTLLFEEAFYQICDAMGIEFISAHVWVGVWIFVISIIVVGCEGSVLIRLITRFTEEIFSALISLLFIYETFFKLYKIFRDNPLQSYDPLTTPFMNLSDLTTASSFSPTESTFNDTNQAKPAMYGIFDKPNTALLSLILCLGCFGIAYYLKFFRNGKYLGRTARRALGDFGIPIAILIMVLIDFAIEENVITEKLNVPDGLKTTDPERGWIINPMGMETPLPIWVIFFAIVPALLAFILIFMETQITAVIVNKPERQLKKGSGFHFDILLIGLYCLISGFIGFPMMGAAAVRSITHTNSLSVYSKTHAPGEKPRLVHVHEQRVTALMVHIVMGFATLIGPVLRAVPLAVLFGVFLYMGVASMAGVQLFDRIEMLFMPVKHHQNEPYVHNVRTWRMHLFTGIQIVCLGILWAVKSTPAALAFPFVLILMVPIQRYLLPCIFAKQELKYLDQSGAIKDDDDDDDSDDDSGKDDDYDADDDLDFYEEAKMSNIRQRRSKAAKVETE